MTMSVIAEWPGSSAHLDKLFEAKSKALGALKNAPRSTKGHYGLYADLATVMDTIRKPLSDNGLDVVQVFVPYDEVHDVLVTTLGHSSGQFIRSFLRMKASLAPQQYAAAATYLKRVALTAIVGIAADDDDDGQAAEDAAVSGQVASVERALMGKLLSSKTRQELSEVLECEDARRLPESSKSRLRTSANHRLSAIGKEAAKTTA